MRSKHTASLALLAGSLLLSAAPSLAPSLAAQSVRGTLLDQATEQPIAGASISLITEPGAQSVASTTTGADGKFTLTAPSPGIYRLLAETPGYRVATTPAMELLPGTTVDFNWRIFAETYRLVPVVIVATNKRPAAKKQNDFYDQLKRRATFGRLITRDQIEKQHPLRVTDLLRTVPGLDVMSAGFRDVVRTRDGCVPLVYLDGIRFPLMGESIDAIVNPNDLEAIEVYASPASVPTEFAAPGAACGAIALWTRRS